MKKLITSLFALMIIISLVACGSSDTTDNRIKVTEYSSDLKGKDYKDVMTLLQAAGFTNIEVELLDDLITGWLTKDGEVEKVSINGVTEFSSSSKYPEDAKIVITYHTFPLKETEKLLEITETSETIQATEVSEISDGRNVSGFDTKTNQTITWHGIEFSFPSYFNVLDEGSSENWMSYYPEEEEYYASLLFQSQEYSGTEEDFNSSIPSIVEDILERDSFANKKVQKSEEILIAGLQGWTIIFSGSDTDGDGVTSSGSYSFAYNIDTGNIVTIFCIYDSNDQSQYDYIGDYKKVLESAKLLAEETILTVNNNKELAAVIKVKDPLDPIVKEFAEKYYGRTIEFDGYIIDLYPHTDTSVFTGKETTYKTIYDVFPIAGNVEDGESTLLYGPTLNMERVTISRFPAIIKNKNVHIIAKVKGYNEKSGFFYLDPISIETR